MLDTTWTFCVVGVVVASLFPPALAQYVLSQGGSSGVSAMQMTVASPKGVVLIDQFQENPLHDENDRPVWAALYSTKSDKARPLHLITNSFCATGTWMSNGTCECLASVRGVGERTGASTKAGFKASIKVDTWIDDQILLVANYAGSGAGSAANTSATNGLQGVRLFTPCAGNGACDVYENPTRIRLTSARWYGSSCRMHDGGAMIFGGVIQGGWTTYKGWDNPTYEYYPPKNINGYNGVQIPSRFLNESLPHNMFPHMALMPDNKMFIAANKLAMLLDWQTNTEIRLPNIPNGQTVTYPMSGVGVLLPLTYENDYRPEFMLCGGSHLPDTLKADQVSSQAPTSKQCSRLVLDELGIRQGWKTEDMPDPRVMPDAVILPTGKILIANGAKTGSAGYGNAPEQIGLSNADNPAFTPVLYYPDAPAGQRFDSSGMPTSSIARMYHSSMTLLPDGRAMIAGSNPNPGVSSEKYRTEYQVEYVSPPYMTQPRPSYTGLPATWNYGQNITLTTTFPTQNPSTLSCVLMDLGFSTHGVHMDMRMVKVPCMLGSDSRSLVISGPPSATIYPPGPCWVYIVTDGVPSVAQTTLIGTGASPPVDQGAIDNMLRATRGPESTSCKYLRVLGPLFRFFKIYSWLGCSL